MRDSCAADGVLIYGLLVVVACLVLALGAASSGCGGSGNGVLETEVLEATLTGADETAPVDTAATGRADFIVNHVLNTIAFDLRADGLEDITAAHIHFGEPGVAGPILFTLSTNASSTPKGLLGSDDLTPDPADGINSIDDAIAAMIAGQTYVNVHTATHPDGAIRGQIEER